MKSKKIWFIIMLLFFVFILGNNLFSQEGRGKGRIKGFITDEQGNSVTGAKIEVTSPRYENLSFTTTSDQSGEWAILGLGTGMWRVTVKAEGYYTTYQEVDVRQLERNPEVNFTLKKWEKPNIPMIEDESSVEFLNQGEQLYSEKNYDEAISLFEQFLEKNPNVYQVHFNIGNCYKEKGEFEKALEEYNKVLEGVQKTGKELKGSEMAAKAMAASGECYLKQDDFENARKYFTQAIEVYPKDEALAYNVGEINFSNNKIEEAIHYFGLATQIKPEWGKPYLRLGYAYLNKGDFQKAKENLQKFLELEPESSDAPTARNIIDYLEKQPK